MSNACSAGSGCAGEEYTRILAFIANRLEIELKTAQVCSREEAVALADRYDIDEFNIVGSNGVCLASTDPQMLGVNYADAPVTQPYLMLITGEKRVVTQPFRVSVSCPDVSRKYLGLPFKDGSGFVQVGIDESRIPEEYDQLFVDYFSAWGDGRVCFFVVAHENTGLITEYSYARDKKTAEGRHLAEIGFPDLHAFPHGTVKLFGETCRYRAVVYADRFFVAVVPNREFAMIKMLFVLVPAVMLALIFLVVIWLSRNIRRTKEAEARLRAAKQLQDREERQRQVADLMLARNIQRSSLPSVFPPFPRDLTIDLFADMVPARDVGGDFYDFFYTGPGRLAMLVADVSGKGVPAAMFMMKAKSTLRELVLSMSDLGEAVAKANEHLCEGNEADMFVTCWIGVFEEETGVLHYVNAGHNPPYLRRANGFLEKLDSVSGIFLGGMSEVRYRTFAEHLAPDDLLFLYTDGVTEANNVLGEFFGESRLEETLMGKRALGLSRFMREKTPPMTPLALCHRVRGAVDAFAGEAAQFDDITLLALQYRGRPQQRQLELPAKLDSVPEFSAFAEKCLDEVACPQAAKADLLVALDEITNNVAQYSGSNQMTVLIETARNPSVVRFSVIDQGTPWNPLEHLDPDITLSPDERAIGGLGILMVKQLMDDVSYTHDNGCNILRFRKQI